MGIGPGSVPNGILAVLSRVQRHTFAHMASVVERGRLHSVGLMLRQS